MFKKFAMFALIAVLLVAAFPFSAAAAAPMSDDPNPGKGKDAYPRIEKVYARLQEWYAKQGEFLAKAPEMISKTETLIEKASAKGLDVSALQSALDAFEATLPAAQSAHDKAGQILAAHAGFDDKGKVTDFQAALQTVKDAGAALREARQAHLEAGQKLREVVRAFIAANRPPRTNNGNGEPLPAPAQNP